MEPIVSVAAKAGIPEDYLECYGKYKAKISAAYDAELKDRPDGRLILVTAVNPTPAGEGKTTVTIGLTQALQKMGKNAITCLREPSLGPCMGVKGGAAGGGLLPAGVAMRRLSRWRTSTCISLATCMPLQQQTTSLPPWWTTISSRATN